MTSEARVVVLDRLWPGDVAGDLLDVVFGWTDFTRLRRLVAGQCAAAGLTGSRLDDFVLAVHEIAANAIVHAGAGAGGRLILQRAANGLRCLVADHALQGAEDPAAPGCWVPRARDGSERCEPADADTGRGLWLAARLTDELSITSGPESTIVSLYIRFE
ncbi:MAG TPA: ATP-binding protein [Streptosporangiaceae bacterium]|nr:ATP-binding protein [Streptosporangiaceae bacterium]